ncbi:MAG: signal peptidase I [Deltaproteobacteria bacterium]|uniref:Signal peptidase I n=1 Tax=Candidatus Zymogenus saltonus TaxID=2844893 RepID=A0A9D8KBT4_9DELT|nr:signal peptidase I [Candidatus Zymogenus saltonus]
MSGSANGREKNKVQRNLNRSTFREYAEAIIFALVLALVIKAFIIQAFKIPSGSMIPTLLRGDQILVNKFIYGTRVPFSDVKLFPIREPERGDIIVFEYPNDRRVHYIKRLIGLPGDEIEIRDKLLYVNGEKYVVEAAHFDDLAVFPGIAGPRDNFGAVTVPADSYFMMGDNRDNSRDSRYWGYVKKSELVGNAVIIYWSWDITSGGIVERIKNIRWSRLGDILLNK